MQVPAPQPLRALSCTPPVSLASLPPPTPDCGSAGPGGLQPGGAGVGLEDRGAGLPEDHQGGWAGGRPWGQERAHCTSAPALAPPSACPLTPTPHTQNNKDYFDQGLDEVKLLQVRDITLRFRPRCSLQDVWAAAAAITVVVACFWLMLLHAAAVACAHRRLLVHRLVHPLPLLPQYVNAADPGDEAGLLRLHDFFYFKVAGEGGWRVMGGWGWVATVVVDRCWDRLSGLPHGHPTCPPTRCRARLCEAPTCYCAGQRSPTAYALHAPPSRAPRPPPPPPAGAPGACHRAAARQPVRISKVQPGERRPALLHAATHTVDRAPGGQGRVVAGARLWAVGM